MLSIPNLASANISSYLSFTNNNDNNNNNNNVNNNNNSLINNPHSLSSSSVYSTQKIKPVEFIASNNTNNSSLNSTFVHPNKQINNQQNTLNNESITSCQYSSLGHSSLGNSFQSHQTPTPYQITPPSNSNKNFLLTAGNELFNKYYSQGTADNLETTASSVYNATQHVGQSYSHSNPQSCSSNSIFSPFYQTNYFKSSNEHQGYFSSPAMPPSSVHFSSYSPDRLVHLAANNPSQYQYSYTGGNSGHQLHGHLEDDFKPSLENDLNKNNESQTGNFMINNKLDFSEKTSISSNKQQSSDADRSFYSSEIVKASKKPGNGFLAKCLPSSSNQKKTRTKDKYRVVYNELQRTELENEFKFSKYITSRRKSELAVILALSQRQIKIWFQNRRAKDRKLGKRKRHDSQNQGVAKSSFSMCSSMETAAATSSRMNMPTINTSAAHYSMDIVTNKYANIDYLRWSSGNSELNECKTHLECAGFNAGAEYHHSLMGENRNNFNV